MAQIFNETLVVVHQDTIYTFDDVPNGVNDTGQKLGFLGSKAYGDGMDYFIPISRTGLRYDHGHRFDPISDDNGFCLPIGLQISNEGLILHQVFNDGTVCRTGIWCGGSVSNLLAVFSSSDEIANAMVTAMALCDNKFDDALNLLLRFKYFKTAGLVTLDYRKMVYALVKFREEEKEEKKKEA